MAESLFSGLMNRSGIIIILAFLLTKIPLFKKLVLKNHISLVEKLFMGVLFGIFGIIGTYYGIPVNGAIANSRVIGVFVGGWLGGPLVGLLAGLIAGGHRWLIDIGGFTAVACGLSTITEGLIGGFGSRVFKKTKIHWLWALIIGAAAEMIQMIIILSIAKPFHAAFNLVSIIWIPMIVVNSIGIAIFIALTRNIFVEQERIGAAQAQLALNIASKTLPYLRRGLHKDSVYQPAKIIHEMTDLAAVAITDTENVLVHIGFGSDHHLAGNEIITAITKEVLESREYRVAESQAAIGCYHKHCQLKSAVIVPLFEGDTVIGTLKLYRTQKEGINNTDIQLALGLAQLFSTQLELCKIELQKELLSKTELKMLQTQINPHFLFNALNTIVSFVRTKPERARELIMHLSDYFRQSLHTSNDDVELKKEIENVESYLAIELARFGEKLRIIYDIPQGIKCLIPPLILQPIVENAVKHGIFNKEEGGTIWISAIERETVIELSVRDDGIGIELDLMNRLMEDMNNSYRIGLANVHKRLIVKYGKSYGLDIQSQLGIGTLVTIHIPKISKEEKNLCAVS